ncbi:prephenate dehydratase [Candidatus Nitrosacidococcus sp. I8]|uniref:prephenate dehydratase n=1 Tax=Candidatus Nitrosacidococcus sp. I8 TaxID=2942908 RepID=UPI002225EFE0|nr:prephenate dehydratase [Candidatus Nitrosacidococcus sp. I8]CAH9018391.1 Bifunctional chorismate mutase/prephenate dehydratase [Candidatus Nitrosacidococcus sp. I8]
MDGNQLQLQKIRAEIDIIDEQIQKLISDRAKLACKTAQLKKSLDMDASCFRPEREADILRRVISRNQGPLGGKEMARLFREIMSACLALETPLTVSYLGPEGTFTEAAVLKHFGLSVNARSVTGISDIFRNVEEGLAHYGVVPVENSIEGAITHTLDEFFNTSLQICGEVELAIHHHLLSSNSAIANIDRVYAHPQALAQCRKWLDTHLEASCERIPVNSNGEAAQRAVNELNCAAIAGERAQKIYNLQCLASYIEDNPRNTTRFLIIGTQKITSSGNDKTSLLISGPNQPGLLYSLLRPLAENQISMTHLESRPSRCGQLWEYTFFIDLEGHQDSPSMVDALSELKKQASFFKLLGSYPKAVL